MGGIMDFLKNIEKRTIIVCPQILKNKILNEINNYNKLVNIKLYTLDELKKLVYFDYDVSTILYLMDKYNYTYEISKSYIENIYYVEDKKYNIEKLDFLVNLKKELIDNNLLIFNELFIKSQKDTDFIIFGYDYIDKFSMKLLSFFNYKIIEKEEINNKNNNVYKFKTMEEEILFVINNIISLLNNDVDINKIVLLNLDKDYNNEIIRMFNQFNIPIDIVKSSSILTTTIGNKVYNYLSITESFSDTLEFIKSFKINDEEKNKIYDIFLNIFNKYVGLDYSFSTIKNAIKYDLSNTIINNNNLKNMVRTSVLENNYFTDENVFLLGFNQGSMPKTIKDEDYINDELKKIIGLSTTSEINKYERIATLKNINSIKNIIISYKETYFDKEFYKSNLLDEKCFTICENNNLDTSYSYIYSSIKLGTMLDNLIKYDKKDDNLSLYYNSLNIKYLEYDNNYKNISKEELYKYLDKKLVLSYSTIDTFFRCQFRYYVDNILKLNKFEESFEIIIGKLFHYVLSKVYDEDFDLDKEYSFFLQDKEFNDKEKFYLKKLKKELIIICNNLREFYNDTVLKDVLVEKDIKIDKSSDIEVIFKGIIDKIMYKKYNNKTLVSIIDYKTGNNSIDLFDSAYGIGMQLIIYLYLISKSDLFEDYYCVGFYLQRILNNEVIIDKNKTYLEQKNDNLKLLGYSIDDPKVLELFDITYENSKYIKSMKYSNEKFSVYSKVLSSDKMKNICNFVDMKIDEARDKILNREFNINPKWFDKEKEPTGCMYCNYHDLCFVKKDNFIRLKKYSDLSFLTGGEENELDL